MERQSAAHENESQSRREARPGGKHSRRAQASVAPLLRLRQTIGNRAAGRFIQAKLKVSEPGDEFEQEADRVADHVMRMPDPAVSREAFGFRATPVAQVQRACAECEEEEEGRHVSADGVGRGVLLQTKRAGGGARPEAGKSGGATESDASRVTDMRGGEPLGESVRAYFEPRFGYGFGRVRVHAGGAASEAARSVNALAFTVGRDIVFGAGQYAPGTSEGRRLLAHELVHVVQQAQARPLQDFTLGGRSLVSPSPAPPRLLQRQLFRRGTNLRFDTFQVTEADLADPDIIARFEALSVEGLRDYRGRVFDAKVVSYINGLIAAKSKAASELERASYLLKVQEAVEQIGSAGLADETLSDVLFPLLKKLSQSPHVIWRDEHGAMTTGKPFAFKAPGKGAKKINLNLVLDEADPKKKPAGYFSASEGHIALFVRKRTTVDEIRETLFHEGMHLAVHVLQEQKAAALGDKDDKAVKALEAALNRPKDIEGVKRDLTRLSVGVNRERGRRGEKLLTESDLDSTSKFLWEEIVVRAQTFCFELLRWLGSPSGAAPSPNYPESRSIKEIYLKSASFLNDADLAALTKDDEKLIALLSTFLLYKMRDLIRACGVPKQYIPHPLEPKTIEVRVPTTRIDPGPIIRLEDLEPDFLEKTRESVKQPPF